MKSLIFSVLLLSTTSLLASDLKIVNAYLSRDKKIVVAVDEGNKIKYISQSKIGVLNDILGCNIATCTATNFKQRAEDLYADVHLLNNDEVLEDVVIGSFIEGSILDLKNISVTKERKILFNVK